MALSYRIICAYRDYWCIRNWKNKKNKGVDPNDFKQSEK